MSFTKFNYIVWIVFFITVTFYSCDKNKDLSGNIILTGYVYLADTSNYTPPIPLGGQKVYLNNGDDTTTYIAEANTDAAGLFSFLSLRENTPYTLFTRFIKDGIEYRGVVKINGVDNKPLRANLNVYPDYMKGMSVTFTDAHGGSIPNLPFRVYTSYGMANVDSIKYAFADTISDINGQYKRFDVNAIKYYFVSKITVGTSSLQLLDSLIVPSAGIRDTTMVLR
jgi:hypothetical protein